MRYRKSDSGCAERILLNIQLHSGAFVLETFRLYESTGKIPQTCFCVKPWIGCLRFVFFHLGSKS